MAADQIDGFVAFKPAAPLLGCDDGPDPTRTLVAAIERLVST